MNPKKQLLWSLWVGLGLLEVFRGWGRGLSGFKV